MKNLLAARGRDWCHRPDVWTRQFDRRQAGFPALRIAHSRV